MKTMSSGVMSHQCNHEFVCPARCPTWRAKLTAMFRKNKAGRLIKRIIHIAERPGMMIPQCNFSFVIVRSDGAFMRHSTSASFLVEAKESVRYRDLTSVIKTKSLKPVAATKRDEHTP